MGFALRAQTMLGHWLGHSTVYFQFYGKFAQKCACTNYDIILKLSNTLSWLHKVIYKLSCQSKNQWERRNRLKQKLCFLYMFSHQRLWTSFWTSSKSDHPIFSYNFAVTKPNKPNIYLSCADKWSHCPLADNPRHIEISCLEL